MDHVIPKSDGVQRIFRTPRPNGFRPGLDVQVPLDIIKDERISAMALGVYVYLLSWTGAEPATLTALTERFSCGRQPIRRALTELTEAGYIDKPPGTPAEWRSHEIPPHIRKTVFELVTRCRPCNSRKRDS